MEIGIGIQAYFFLLQTPQAEFPSGMEITLEKEKAYGFKDQRY